MVRIGIMTKVSCFSQHLLSPHEGHISSVNKVIRYLQSNISKNPVRIAFDPACINTYENLFEGSTRELEDWKDFYPDASEAHQRKKLEPLEEPATVWVYEDAKQGK